MTERTLANQHRPAQTRIMQFDGELAWFHATVTTYGAWLPGDPRGFRTRDHREHIEGDYKAPPTVDYSRRQSRSQALMAQPAVTLAASHRLLVTDTFLRTLDYYGLDAACIATAGRHVHVLCKLPGRTGRRVVAGMKRETTNRLKAHGHHGKVWANRSRIEPIRDCRHWSNTMGYIIRHEMRGGALWVWEGPQSCTPQTHLDASVIREARVAQRVREEGERWYQRLPIVDPSENVTGENESGS